MLIGGETTPAWGQLTPVGPPPLAPLPTPPAPQPAPGPEIRPRPPGEAERPGTEPPARAPEAPGVTAPPPPTFEFIRREPARPDPNLIVSPLEVPRRFLLRASLTEEFDDNVRLAPGGRKQGDLSTIATLAGQYRFETSRTFLQTANSINARYSPRFSDRQGLSFADINIIGGHQFTPRFSVGASESFFRSNDLLHAGFTTATGAPATIRSPLLQAAFTTATGAPATIPGARTEFSRNSFSPQASYALTDRTAVTAGYANTLVIQEGNARGTGNSITHNLNGSLSHRLRERTAGSLGYSHLISKSRGNNVTGDDVTAGVSHTLSPRTTVSLNGSAAFRTLENAPRQQIYALSVGAARQLSSTFSASGAVGLQDVRQSGRDTVNPTFDLSLSKQGLRYQVSAAASWATAENIGQVNDVGLTRSQVLTVNYTYFPSQVWFFTLGGSYARTDFKLAPRASLIGIQPSTIDKLYAVFTAVDYRLARSLFLRLSYNFLALSSTEPLRRTSDNRVAVSISTEISR